MTTSRRKLVLAYLGSALIALAGCTSTLDPVGSPAIPDTTPPPDTPSAAASAVPSPSTVPATPSISPRTPTGPLTVPTVESQPVPYVNDPALEQLIRDVLGQSEQSYAVYVKSLEDGRGASVNPDRAYPAASIFKLYVMWEAFRQESLGLISFADTMEVTPYYKSWDLGTDAVEVGDLVTVDEALRFMMSISDTPTGVLLQDTLNHANVNAALEALGIYNSGLFYPGDPVATARDVGALLEAIAHGGILPQASHESMIGLLLSAQTDNGLRAGVPAKVAVAHKTGSLPKALHDAGIVYLPGAEYVLVVLWDRQGDVNLIQTISRRVYEYLVENE